MKELWTKSWLEELVRKTNISSIVFLQLGASNEPLRRALVESHATAYSLSEYINKRLEILEPGVFVIDEIESLNTKKTGLTLGELRECLFEDVAKNMRFILLSRAPRIAFPTVVGSSLFEDATFAHAPYSQKTGHQYWPTCVEDRKAADEVLETVLKELGLKVCASLDRVVYEDRLTDSDALLSLSARELEALDAAGLTYVENGLRGWTFPRHLEPLRTALDAVLAEWVEPQLQFARVSEGLWKIERMIRRAVRAKAIAVWEKSWKTDCLHGDLSEKVLRRATESAYIQAKSVKTIRDPLEWLSLGELLEIRKKPAVGSLGLESKHWDLFAAEIIPIRNRLAHLRNLRHEDEANVVKWRSLLETRLNDK